MASDGPFNGSTDPGGDEGAGTILDAAVCEGNGIARFFPKILVFSLIILMKSSSAASFFFSWFPFSFLFLNFFQR